MHVDRDAVTAVDPPCDERHVLTTTVNILVPDGAEDPMS
jgi:hypothetical protein